VLYGGLCNSKLHAGRFPQLKSWTLFFPPCHSQAEPDYTLANNQHGDDGRAGLSRIEIDAHSLLQGKQAGLIGAKTDGGECAVFEEGYECDLNRPSCPIKDTADLHSADRALDGGPGPDRAANEYIAATGRGHEK